MLLEDIRGHEAPIRLLQNSLRENRVAHAYLFTGPAGIGKEMTARAFAQAHLCQEGSVLGQACDQCLSCRKLKSGNHPDWKLIQPQGASLKIDQIRELLIEVNLKSYEGHGKVYILTDVEKMTVQAANAFLKLLEEPPEGVLLLLCSSQPYKLLPTILSRCQVVQFYPLKAGEVANMLVEQRELTPERGAFIAAMAAGIPARAFGYTDNNNLDQRRTRMVEIAEELLGSDELAVFSKIEELEKQKPELVENLDMLATWFRDLLIWKTTEKLELMINCDIPDKIKAQSKGFSQGRLEMNLAVIEKTKDYLRSNVNNRLALNNMFMDLWGG